MKYKIKGLPLIVLLSLYCVSICYAGESLRLSADEVRTNESLCKLDLRRIASAQLAYSEANRHKAYGTWWSLIENGYVEEGMSRRDFIENYSLAVFDVMTPSLYGGESAYDSTFTVVAIPSRYQNQLRTFAIDDNRFPLVWVGQDGELNKQLRSWRIVGLDNPDEWDAMGINRKSRIESRREKKKEEWEEKCKLTLRALGASQLAYMDGNRRKDYGSWHSLRKNNYIVTGYTRANIIENYSIAFFQAIVSGWKSGKRLGKSSFSIVAVPRSQKWGLRTFGICDDQTPRMWVGNPWNFRGYLKNEHKFDMSNRDEWQPLR